jgi:hypothetical protein
VVSHSFAWIGLPCLRHCVHGASIGGGGGPEAGGFFELLESAPLIDSAITRRSVTARSLRLRTKVRY